MSFGAIYCSSWWGSGIGSDGWGKTYPIALCGGSTADSTNVSADTTLLTADKT